MNRKPPFTKPAQHPSQNGFVLVIIIITGILVGAGLMAMTARTFAGLFGSIRQGHNQEAREAAESGLAVLLRELNTNYPYLLTTSCETGINSTTGLADCSSWRSKANGGTFEYETSVCPSTTTPPETLFSKLSATLPGGRTRYRLLEYKFKGNIGQGGIGEFKVEGQSINTNNSVESVRATAHLRQDTTIIPKGCRGAQGGYPGLLGENIDLGNQNVLGPINGNVVSLTCDPNQTQKELEICINLQNQGDVEGQIFGGRIAMPEPPLPPTFPTDEDYFKEYSRYPATTLEERSIVLQGGERTLTAGSDNGGLCFTDSANVTHCSVHNIELGGSSYLKVDTNIEVDSGPKRSIRLYITGEDSSASRESKPGFTVSGQADVFHTGDSPIDFSIFGTKLKKDEECSQNAVIGGTSTALKAFIFMPNACAGINGGGKAEYNLEGSMWVRDFDRSNSNAGNIFVPDDMGSLVCARFGINFCIGIREYAARGAQNWYLTPKQQQP